MFCWRKRKGGFGYIKSVSKSTNSRELLSGVVCPRIYPEIYLAKKIFKKILVSRNFRQAHLLEVGLTKIPGDHETLSLVRHVGLHVDLSSMKYSLGL